jgi:hypothetical protein
VPFCAFGTASRYDAKTTRLKEHSFKDTGGVGWVSMSWDHWPIGWLNSQAHPVDAASLAKYPNHFSPAGMDLFALSNETVARGEYWSLLGVAGDNLEAARQATRQWLELGGKNVMDPAKVEALPSIDQWTTGLAERAKYPADWWKPAPAEGAPAWEILPQAAGPGEVILSKRNDLGLLSNFAATPFTFHGKRYASLEGLWQSMLYPEEKDDPRARFPGLTWKYTRDEVAQMTAFDAKHAGDLAKDNMKKMGIDWVTFEGRRMPYKPKEPGEHYRLIVEATREKVRQNPEVQMVLLSTGALTLKPDHHQEPDAPAAWRYYDILTQIRSEFQAPIKPD